MIEDTDSVEDTVYIDASQYRIQQYKQAIFKLRRVQPTTIQPTREATQHQAKTTLIQSNWKGRIIQIGTKAARATHIKQRCEKLVGLAVERALKKMITNARGQEIQYKKADLKYDF